MGQTPIDAVALVRRIRDAHAEELSDASPEERIEFYRQRAKRLHERLVERHPALEIDPVPPDERR